MNVKIHTLLSNNEANVGSTEAFAPRKGREGPALDCEDSPACDFAFLPILNSSDSRLNKQD
jgi:hypothetical protein